MGQVFTTASATPLATSKATAVAASNSTTLLIRILSSSEAAGNVPAAVVTDAGKPTTRAGETASPR